MSRKTKVCPVHNKEYELCGCDHVEIRAKKKMKIAHHNDEDRCDMCGHPGRLEYSSEGALCTSCWISCHSNKP